jgi:hypothetical protein
MKTSQTHYSFSPAAGPRISSPGVIHIKSICIILFNFLFEDGKMY